MEKKKKWLALLIISLLFTGIVAAAIVYQLWLSTKVTLIVPYEIQASPTSWDWGTLYMTRGEEAAFSTQNVTFVNYGAEPLTLSATVNQTSMTPSWFTPHYYTLEWTGQNYQIQPLEVLETTFNFTVNVPLARSYMIDHQIREVEVSFNILISGSNITLPVYNLTIGTTTGGTTDPAPGTYQYVEGTTVSVNAIANLGYDFNNWILDGVNYTDNPITIVMDSNHTLTAYFKVAGPKVYINPASVNVPPGQNFTITVVISNVEDLYGFDIQLSWNASIIHCVSYELHTPVEDYPDGVLYSSVLVVKNTVDESDSISGAELGTMGWWAVTSMAPAPSFNGTGIAVELTFTVEAVGTSPIHIVSSTLSDSQGAPITHDAYDAVFDNR